MATRSQDHGISPEIVSLIKCRSRSIARRIGVCPGDHDDFQQELLVHVWQHSPRHDPARASLRTFLARLVDRRAASLLDAATARKRNGGARTVSLDEPAVDADGEPVPRIALLTEDDQPWPANATAARDRIDLRLDLHRAVRTLPDRLIRVCHRLCGETVTEIARDTGLPRSTLYGALAEVRAAFRSAGLDTYLAPSPTDSARFR